VHAIVGGKKFIMVAYPLQYPVLSPGRDEFVYESCTPLPKGPGFLDGSLTFVPGRYVLISIESIVLLEMPLLYWIDFVVLSLVLLSSLKPFFSARLSRPEGKPFQVSVPPIPLDMPEYIF
jgi:F-box protein 3